MVQRVTVGRQDYSSGRYEAVADTSAARYSEDATNEPEESNGDPSCTYNVDLTCGRDPCASKGRDRQVQICVSQLPHFERALHCHD